MLYYNGDDNIKCVILTDVRIHLIIIQRYSILVNSLKHLGLPKCIVSKHTCFPKMDSGRHLNPSWFCLIRTDKEAISC